MNKKAIHVTASMLTVAILVAFCAIPSVWSDGGWTPENMMEFKRITATALSPYGNQVAYTVSVAQMEGTDSSYLTHIFLIPSQGGESVQLTHGDTSCYDPEFSPDGRYLSFRTYRSGRTQVWLLPLSGGEAMQLTDAVNSVRSYKWSPDAKGIAYLMTDPQTDIDKQNNAEKRDMSLRDENDKFVHLYMTTLAKGSEKSITRRLTEGDFHINSFDWAPDSSALVFSHRPSPSPDVWDSTDISTVSLNNGRVTTLVDRRAADRYPMWSPDGSMIAFPSDADDPHWALMSDLYVVSPKGGEAAKCAETPDRNFMYYGSILGWSHDSSEVYVREASRTSWRVFAIPVKGGEPRMVTTGTGNCYDVSFSRDGSTMAFVHSTSDSPPELYVTKTASYTPKKLTNVNSDYHDFPLGKTEIISWKSKDGLEIEGLLTYPVGYRKGNKYPLILYMHGGPSNLNSEVYTAEANKYPIQAFAQEGYAILRTNPRGSSGYGKEFRYANIEDWGVGDFDDQTAGVDKVIAMGIAHPDSLCVTGWSYGGYMTAVTVTKTDRFKAAVMGAGISNLVSFTGTCDIPSFIPDYFKGEFWERPDIYIKHSPVFHTKGVTTPTLILHGSNDRRVPPSQGEEFYNALKRQGCPTRLVVYPRTSHSPSEPKFTVDVGERIIDWFNLHLGR